MLQILLAIYIFHVIEISPPLGHKIRRPNGTLTKFKPTTSSDILNIIIKSSKNGLHWLERKAGILMNDWWGFEDGYSMGGDFKVEQVVFIIKAQLILDTKQVFIVDTSSVSISNKF